MALRLQASPPEAAPPPTPADEPLSPSEVLVEYRGEAPVLVRSPASGRLYAFSPGRRVRGVPRGDVQQLLRSPLFRRGQH